MRNLQYTILNDVDTATVTGAAINSGQWVSASFQSIFGDVTAAGTIKIQGSNDFSKAGTQMAFTPTNWNDIPNATATIASGVGPMILIPNMAFEWVRAVYTRTSGGSTTVIVQANALSI